MLKGISVRCDTCPALLQDAEFNGAGLTVGEKGDHLLRLAKRDGWAARVKDHVASFLCPACVAAQWERNNRPFEPFAAENECAKCGGAEIKTRYCTGLTPDCTIKVTREHLHRTCQQCGYDWQQDPKDATEKDDGSAATGTADAGGIESAATP